MSDFDRVLNKLTSSQASAPTSPLLSEQSAYDAIAATRTGAENGVEDEVAQDMLNLNSMELIQKYGFDRGSELDRLRGQAEDRYRNDRTGIRTGDAAAADTLRGVGRGAVNGVGGLVALGTGLVSDEGGAAVSESLAGFNDWTNSFDSAALRGRRDAYAGRQRADEAASAKQYEDEGGGFVASLRKIGRDAKNTFGNMLEDGAVAGDVVAEGTGSLVGGVPIIGVASKGAKGVRAVAASLQKGGVVSRAARLKAGRLATAAAPTAGIMAMESGGVYQQTMSEVMGMSHDDLMLNSPEYREMLEAGQDPEQAKLEIASSAALVAAGTTAPAAAVLGKIVDKFEANPFGAVGGRQAFLNMGKEAFEEGAQGAVGTVASNAAIARSADTSREIADGVGAEIATGAVGGVGAAGVTQAPGIAARTAVQAADGTVKEGQRLWQKALEREAGLTEETESKGATGAKTIRDQIAKTRDFLQSSGAAIAEGVGSLVADLNVSPESETVEGPAELQPEDFQRLGESILLNPESLATAPDFVREGVGEVDNTFDAIANLAKKVNQLEDGSAEQLTAARYLIQMKEQGSEVLESGLVQRVKTELAEDHPARVAIEQIEDTLRSIESNTGVRRAEKRAQAAMAAAVEKGSVAPISAAELSTPEGQTKVADAISVAETVPSKSSYEANETILSHANQGLIELTRNQRAALTAANAVIEAERAATESVKSQGLMTNVDLVSGQAISSRDTVADGAHKSLATHAREITRAYKVGDMETAQSSMALLKNFAEGMGNKVAGLNQHFQQGGGKKETGVQYETALPGKAAKITANTPAYVDLGSASSVRFAQTVGKEAEILADTYNKMVDIFPELEMEKIEPIALEQGLQLPAEQVVENAKNPVAAEPTKTEEPAEKPADPAPKAEPKTEDPGPENAPEPAKPVEQAEAAPEPDLSKAELAGRYDARTNSRGKAPADFTPAEVKAYNAARKDEAAVIQAEQEAAAPVEAPVEQAPEPIAETKAEPEAKVEEPAPEPVVEEAPVEETVEEAEPTPEDLALGDDTDVVAPSEMTLGNYFPRLIGIDPRSKVKNLFLSTFRLRKNRGSRLIREYQPMAFVRGALNSSAEFERASGNPTTAKLITPEVAQAYDEFLAQGDLVLDRLNKQLRSFLKTPAGKDDSRTKLQQLAEEGKLNTYRNGRTLNLIERSGDKIGYNEVLAEAAVLAGMQWLLDSRHRGAVRDEADVFDVIGGKEYDNSISQGDLQSLYQIMRHGQTRTGAVRSLAAQIERYWDVELKSDGYVGVGKGIPEAMAKEILEAMSGMGILQESNPVVDILGAGATVSPEKSKNGEGLGLKAPMIINLDPALRDVEGNAFLQAPNAIEQVAVLKPETHGWSVGTPPQGVARTQLNNPKAELTDEQRKAIRSRQNNPHTLNQRNLKLFKLLGSEGVQTLFGGGFFEGDQINKAHQKSVEGRDLTAKLAYEGVLALEAELRGHVAGNPQVSMKTVPVYFPYTFNKSNRQQIIGTNNPQASKLMREVVMPTASTLNLTNPEHFANFMLGVAQHIGVKVEKQSHEQGVARAEEMLRSSLAPAVAAATDFLNDEGTLPDGFIETMREAFGGSPEPAAIHSIIEYARYLNAIGDSEALSNFETQLYIEADGVTNGPINALALFSGGSFTPAWVANMERGGLNFDDKPKSMNTFTGDDLYQKGATNWSNIIGEKGLPHAHAKRVVRMMTMFLGNDLEILTDDQGRDYLEIKRGLTKNPLTVTLYGAGESGLASKLTSTLTTAIYERMTDALGRMADGVGEADALFPNDPDAAEKLEKFWEDASELTQKVLVQKEGEYVLAQQKRARPLSRNFRDFAVEFGNYGALKSNVQASIVPQLRAAIEDTVGPELMRTLEDIRISTQIMALGKKYAWVRGRDEAIEAEKKAAGESDYVKSNFLRKSALREVDAEAAKVHKPISTGRQNFVIENSEKAEAAATSFTTTLSNLWDTPGYVDAPANIGVKGIPTVVIGSADGMMMQIFSAVFGADRTGDVFDGMNLPLDTMKDLSRKVNESVAMAWQENPLQAVADSFSSFAEGFSVGDKTDAEFDELLDAMFGRERDKSEDASLDPVSFVQELARDLQDRALYVQARQNAMARVKYSVDQMASADAPYAHNADIVLTGTPEQKAEALNKLLNEEVAKLEAKREAQDQVELAPDVVAVTAEDDSGARVMGPKELADFGKSLKGNREQQQILEQMTDFLGDRWTVVTGSKTQLRSYLLSKGHSTSHLDQAGTNGFILPGSQTVVIANASREVLTHEIVHAATYAALDRYYSGQLTDPRAKVAVEKLKALKDQFLKLDMSKEGGATLAAYGDALEAILTHSRAGNQAAALNEFMAWGLTNQHLARKLKATKANTLGQFVQKFVDAAKRVLFGRRANLKVADDMFTNLRFGNVIVASAGRGVRDYIGDTALYHSESYGNSEWLQRVNRAMQHKVVSHLKDVVPETDDDTQADIIKDRLDKMSDLGKATARAIEIGFGMNQQEQTTFNMLVNVMGSAVELDPNAMSKAADMYAHVAETVKIEEFMEDPTNGPDSDDWYRARGKYDLVLGRDVVGRDEQNRSTLVPIFVALSMTSPDMKRVLANLEAPVREGQQVTGIDTWLENTGMNAMDALSNAVSGVGQNSATVGAVMSHLSEQLVKTAEERNSMLDLASSKASGVVDTINDRVASWMQQGAEALYDKADQAERDFDNKVAKKAAEAVKVFAAIGDRAKGNQLAENLVGEVNRTMLPDFAQRLISDFIGRTENNAPIYDMIKRVHSWVSQTRQQFREELPRIIKSKFSRDLSEQEWADLMRGMGKTDLSALRASMNESDILRLVTSQTAIDQKITSMETAISAMAGKQWPLLQRKALQLANYMNTGQPGSNLLRNAEAVTRLLGEKVPKSWEGSPELSVEINQLITLYALNGLDQRVKDTLASLASEGEGGEFEGMRFTLNLLNQLRKDESDRTWGNAHLNFYKGHVPTKQTANASVIVATDDQQADLEFRGYTRVGDYAGSDSDRSTRKRGYYVSNVSAKATYRQGIMQTVQQTAGGVELHTGYTNGPETSGVISDDIGVKTAWRNRFNESAAEPLLPVWGSSGEIVAYERSVAPEQLAPLKREESLPEAMGVWRGRQFEEAQGRQWNQALIKRLGDMHRKDVAAGKQDQYVDLFRTKDKVWKDALNTLPRDTLQMVQAEFGEHFWVRRDMIDDAVGYRDASIRNAWDGQTRLDPRISKVVRTLATNAFGKDGYSKLVNAESIIQNVATDLRVMIVVKSMIVPAANFSWNIVQLATRGVPLLDVARSFPRKTDEINTYLRVRAEKIDLEAELAGVGSNLRRERQLKAEIQKINDQIRRLSIHPLIEAGEFTSISDGLLSKDDLALSEGRIGEYIEQAVDKLPKAAQTLAKYGIVARDTALFKALQRSVEYGDFLAKATLYDHLTKKKGLSQDEALAMITEEFVNYDRLPGRARGYLEQMGLLWFWNFKIRSTKVAVSMVRNNPVHALLAMNAPIPTDLLGPVGSPLTDNAVDVLLDGRADYSIGPGMAFRAPDLLPVMQLF